MILSFLLLAAGFWLYTREYFVIMCIGDSLTAEAYPDYLQENLNQAGIRARVINKGIRGNTSGEYLKYLQSSQILQEIRPHVVLLELGTNDVRTDSDHTEIPQFMVNMNQIIDFIQNSASSQDYPIRILLATIPPIVIDTRHRLVFDENSRRRVVEEINPAIKKIAKDRGLPLIDIYQLFQQYPEFLPGIHPTLEGYKAMADMWFNQLAPFMNSLSVKNKG